MTEHEHKLKERQGAAMAVVLVVGIILLCGWNKATNTSPAPSGNIEMYNEEGSK